MAPHPLTRTFRSEASLSIKQRVQAAVPQLHWFSNGFTRKLEPSARIPRTHTPVEAVTPPYEVVAIAMPAMTGLTT